jgi:outer membrane protein TolC
VALANLRIASADELVAIERAKRDAGLLRAVDVLRVDESRHNARKRVEELLADRSKYVGEIAILLDESPYAFSLPGARLPPSLPLAKALDTPLAVVERRPDLQNARLAIVRAVSQLNVAEIDRLPNLSLSLPSLSAGAASLQDVLRSPVASMSASLTAPILDWGKRLRARDRERLNLDAALLDYTERVYKALAEVSNVLASAERNDRQVALNAAREQRLDREYLARRAQYEVGKIEKTRLIEAGDAVSEAKIEAIETRLTGWLNRIELLKALAEPLSLGDQK